MSEDLQGNRWWLASDGKWYPPDLHPDARAPRPDEQDRNKALLKATIGVALVRERVFAEVLGERRGESPAPAPGAEQEPEKTATGQTTATSSAPPKAGPPRAHDPLPRFRGSDSAAPALQPVEADPDAPGPEPRWRPESQQVRPPTARAASWLERAETEAASLKFAPRPGVIGLGEPPVPNLARWQQGTSPEPAWATPSPAVPPVPSGPYDELGTDAGALWTSPYEIKEPTPPPPPAPLAEVGRFEASALADKVPSLAPPPPPQGAGHEGRSLPPSARRRPSRARSTAALRDAVAGAVARAAAQGPLAPRGSDEEDEPTATQGPGAAGLWPESELDQAQLDKDANAVATAPEPEIDKEPLFGPPSPAAAVLSPDPYEEFARLAGEHVSATASSPLQDEAFSSPQQSELDEAAATPEDEPAMERLDEMPDAAGSRIELEIEIDLLDEEAEQSADQLTVALADDLAGDRAAEALPKDDDTGATEQLGRAGQLPGETILSEDLLAGDLLVEEPLEVAVTDDSPREHLLVEKEPTGPAAVPGSNAETAEGVGLAAPEESAQVAPEAAEWAFGERRSAARQARKPLPAALQEAVAAGAAQELGEPATALSRQASDSEAGQREGKDPGGGKKQGSAKRPGIVRRYGSAIVIVVLFLAAGGVAAGVAAFHGPVNPPTPSTAAQDQSAASNAVLTSADFPANWQFSPSKGGASSLGLGSFLLTPSLVRAWLAGNRACSADLGAVTAAMTPNVGNLTAVAWSQATTTNTLGGLWQIGDAISFHTTAAQVSTDVARMRAVLTKASARRCVARFWSASLQAQLPAGSLVMMTVSPRSLPQLSGRAVGWAMEMKGTDTLGQSSTPLRFEMTSFGVGRAQMFFAVSSKAAALPANIAGKALAKLVKATAGLDSPTA